MSILCLFVLYLILCLNKFELNWIEYFKRGSFQSQTQLHDFEPFQILPGLLFHVGP